MYKIGINVRKDLLNIRHSRRYFMNWQVGCQFAEEDRERRELIFSKM